jgi:hypothetical protein
MHFDETLYDDLVQLLDLVDRSGLRVGRLEDHLGADQAQPSLLPKGVARSTAY